MASSNPTPIYTSLTDVTRSRPRTLQPAARRSSGRLRGRRRTSGPPIEPCGAIVFSKRSDYGAQQVPLGPARAPAYLPPHVWPCAPLFRCQRDQACLFDPAASADPELSAELERCADGPAAGGTV